MLHHVDEYLFPGMLVEELEDESFVGLDDESSFLIERLLHRPTF